MPTRAQAMLCTRDMGRATALPQPGVRDIAVRGVSFQDRFHWGRRMAVSPTIGSEIWPAHQIRCGLCLSEKTPLTHTNILPECMGKMLCK